MSLSSSISRVSYAVVCFRLLYKTSAGPTSNSTRMRCDTVQYPRIGRSHGVCVTTRAVSPMSITWYVVAHVRVIVQGCALIGKAEPKDVGRFPYRGRSHRARRGGAPEGAGKSRLELIKKKGRSHTVRSHARLR